ncbi:hypothetical protein [Pantoea eucrina]|uniref:hypothetical protein n=1 Tax=Pantoea eucrina TaxID=472693 RepID=UPI001301AC7A|nr:hypothetical protein [Pantoea eucrina]
MENDNDRVELIANAILKAALELADTGAETTIEELLGRLEPTGEQPMMSSWQMYTAMP